MKISNQKTIVTIIGTVLIIAGLLVFVYLPMTKSIKELRTQITEKRIDKTILESQYNQSNITDDINQLIEQNDELNKYFISKNQLLEFITGIEKIATDNDVSENMTLPELPDKNDEIFEHPVTIAPTGTYDNIIEYLSHLESLDYYLSFNKLEISRTSLSQDTEPKNNNSILRANLSGLSYWQ